MGVYAEAVGLDPLGPAGSGGTAGATELMAIYDTVMVWDSESSTYEPRLAESLESDPTFTTWTLVLKPGISFGNGDPLTAAAVKTSIERHQADGRYQTTRPLASNIQSMNVVDELTVTLSLVGPWPQFPHVLATDVGMITNQKVIDEMGQEAFEKLPVGGGVGAYEVEKYTPGEELILRAKPNYWDGPVCIQELRFVRISGSQGTYEAFSNGELDVAFLREPEPIAEAREAGFGALPTLFNAGEMIAMNSSAEAGRPTADVRVRRAVAAAVDPDSINARAFNGEALATSALIQESTPLLYQDLPGPVFDPQGASRLVADLKQDGFDGNIRLLTDNSPTRINTGIAVKAQLEAAGFAVNLDNGSSLSEVIKRVTQERDFDMVLWGGNYAAEGMWSSMNRQLNSTAPSNYYGYADPEMDRLLDRLKVAESPDDQREVLKAMQDLWIRSVPSAILAAVEETVVYQERIGGLKLSRAASVRFDDAYIAG